MSSRPTVSSRVRLGAHMSVEGGLHRAVDRAVEVEATALQIFVKSSRRWSAPRASPDAVGAFRTSSEASGLATHTLAHASYLINPASPDAAVRERSVGALRDELERCDELGVPFLVLHPGSHVGTGEAEGLARVVRALDRALPQRGKTVVLLETTAGQGSNLGHRFEQLGWILDRVRRPARFGVCFDTCHVLAAGYRFDDAASFRRTFDELDRTIGLERLRAFHLNDSKYERGSRRDRHEHIGRGTVGLETFRLILNDRRFRGMPMVLETPKGPDLAEDRANLATLRALLQGKRP